MKRIATFQRKTKETDICLSVNADGSGKYGLDCPLGFLSHMLQAFSRFSLIDISGSLSGDTEVDGHHSVEDLGLALGSALREALGAMGGLSRCGSAYFPMDEALVRAVIDFSGRPFCVVKGKRRCGPAGDFSRELFEEFWQGFCRGARATLHIDLLRGTNGHHIYEAGFKASGRAVMEAIRLLAGMEGAVPSTKGSIDGIPSGAPAGVPAGKPYPEPADGTKARLA
jgi:imidazoleglycerol-phosphate dehydratase